jgi:hypothetical protein
LRELSVNFLQVISYMGPSTHDHGCEKATGQSDQAKDAGPVDSSAGSVAKPPDDSGAFMNRVDPTKLSSALKPTKPSQVGRKVCRRVDGWWVVDERDVEVAGPFTTLTEVEAFLDWESNQP